MLQDVTSQQAQAIEAISGGATLTEVAASLGISRMTLYRWQNDPGFLNALHQCKLDMIDQISINLTRLAGRSLQVLNDILNAPDTPVQARLRAVEIVLGRTAQFQALADQEQRLLVLENIVQGLLHEKPDPPGDEPAPAYPGPYRP